MMNNSSSGAGEEARYGEAAAVLLSLIVGMRKDRLKDLSLILS
jgi:hypothetical protein